MTKAFCAQCLADSLDVGTGDIGSFNGIGLALIGFGPECPNCGAVVKRLFFCFGVPLFPLGKFRVIYLSNEPYGFLGSKREMISRRIGTAYRNGDASPMLEVAAKLEGINPQQAIDQ